MLDRKIKITVGDKSLELAPHDFLENLDSGKLKFCIMDSESQQVFKKFVAELRKAVYN